MSDESPREPKAAAGDWTEERGACDERRGKEPAVKGDGEVVGPGGERESRAS